MIGHYLSSNNEMCYSTKTNNFSPTKQGQPKLNGGSKPLPLLAIDYGYGEWLGAHHFFVVFVPLDVLIEQIFS